MADFDRLVAAYGSLVMALLVLAVLALLVMQIRLQANGARMRHHYQRLVRSGGASLERSGLPSDGGVLASVLGWAFDVIDDEDRHVCPFSLQLQPKLLLKGRENLRRIVRRRRVGGEW